MDQAKQLSAEELKDIIWRDGHWEPYCAVLTSPYADHCGYSRWDHPRPGYEPSGFDMTGQPMRLPDHPFMYPDKSPEADRRRLLEQLEMLMDLDSLRE